MDDALFNELLEAAHEAVAHRRGEKTDLRTTVLPEPPRPMSRAAVKRLRERLHVSQPVFAHFLSVSPKLVQAWEGGTRTPEGPALVLLRLAERRPDVVFAPSEGESPASRRQPASARSGVSARGTRSQTARGRAAATAPLNKRTESAKPTRRAAAHA